MITINYSEDITTNGDVSIKEAPKFKLSGMISVKQNRSYWRNQGFDKKKVFTVVAGPDNLLSGLYVANNSGELFRLQSETGDLTGNGRDFESRSDIELAIEKFRESFMTNVNAAMFIRGVDVSREYHAETDEIPF